MIDAWIVVVGLALSGAIIRASGPLLMGGRVLHPRVAGVVDLLAPALLTALIVVETLGGQGSIEISASLVGVAAAGLVLIRRRDAILAAIIVAAVVTAVVRALG